MHVRSLEAIKGGGGGHSVGTHVFKDQPVTHLQVRQVALLNDAIKAITCWTPDTARVPDLIWLWLLLVLREVGAHAEVNVTVRLYDEKLRWHFNPSVSLTLCSVGKQ